MVIVSSPRKGGNSDLLCDQFILGAHSLGHKCEKVYLDDMHISCCKECMACQVNGGKCVICDDFQTLAKKMIKADVIVFSSPVFFYNVSAQLKTLMDRTFSIESAFKNKKVYLLLAGAAPFCEYMETTVYCFKGYVSSFENIELKGIVLGVNSVEKGSIAGQCAMEEAFSYGKTLDFENKIASFTDLSTGLQ